MSAWFSLLVAALLAGGLITVNAALDRPTSPAEVVALAAGCALVAGLLGEAHQRRRMRAQVEGVVQLTANLTTDPGQSGVLEVQRVIRGGLMAPLTEHLEGLAAAYRKALSNVVELQEQLDALVGTPLHGRDRLSRRPVSATHIVVGSSRHRMVARLAPNLNFTAATQPLCRVLRRSNTELMACSILDVFHAVDAETIRQAVQEALRDGEAHNVVGRVMVPEGERFLQLDLMTCYNDDGQPINLRCHFTDITDRVQTERELRRITTEVSEANARLRQSNLEMERLKESYRDLYHHAPVLYFSLDAEGKLVAFNESFLRALGYPRERLHGAPYEMLLTDEARAALAADPTMMERAGDVETQWVRGDGTTIDVWIGTTTIRDASGEFLRSRSAARDVTEENRLAHDLHVKAEEVMRGNLQLRRINQELEEFSYVVSHDLKEPLRTLEAFSNFLAQDYGPQLKGEGQQYIDHLVQASRRLGRLIDDLLALSRNGRVIHSPRPFDWSAVIQTVRRDLHDLIGRKSAVVRVEGELPSCMGDPERIVQLMENLVSNGLKYNTGPAPEVVIGCRRALGSEPTLYVRDNGIGIDPVHHTQIFGIFRRLHHRNEFEGTGAGLAICKRIVEAHGGRIWVESKPGEGATFLFTLPAARPGVQPRRTEVKLDAVAAGR
jgi:PAS domain S-box-containing protein